MKTKEILEKINDRIIDYVVLLLPILAVLFFIVGFFLLGTLFIGFTEIIK